MKFVEQGSTAATAHSVLASLPFPPNVTPLLPTPPSPFHSVPGRTFSSQKNTNLPHKHQETNAVGQLPATQCSAVDVQECTASTVTAQAHICQTASSL